MTLLIVPLVLGVLGAAMASGKNRNALGWGLLCFLLPVLGLLILLFTPRLPSQAGQIAKAVALATSGADSIEFSSTGEATTKAAVSAKVRGGIVGGIVGVFLSGILADSSGGSGPPSLLILALGAVLGFVAGAALMSKFQRRS